MQRSVSSGGAASAAGSDVPESLRPTNEDIAQLLASGFFRCCAFTCIGFLCHLICSVELDRPHICAGCQLGGKNCEAGDVPVFNSERLLMFACRGRLQTASAYMFHRLAIVPWPSRTNATAGMTRFVQSRRADGVCILNVRWYVLQLYNVQTRSFSGSFTLELLQNFAFFGSLSLVLQPVGQACTRRPSHRRHSRRKGFPPARAVAVHSSITRPH